MDKKIGYVGTLDGIRHNNTPGTEEKKKATNLSEYAKIIMEDMEKRGFTQGEAEHFPEILRKKLKENSRQKEYYRPFAVFHDGN